jgi:hypothetical protein
MVTAMRGFPITELLPEQRRYVDLYREEYIKVGRSTEPADRPRAEAAITQLYAAIGKASPTFEWGESPQWVVDRIVERSPEGSLKRLMSDDCNDSLTAKSWEWIHWNTKQSIKGSIEVLLIDSLQGPRFATVSKVPIAPNITWVALYRYAADVLLVPYRSSDLEKLHLHDEVARSCGYWAAYEEICFCVDRPELFELEESWCVAGPRFPKHVRYRDGFEIIASPWRSYPKLGQHPR